MNPSADHPHSPKQVARVLGVSESSLKRWCDQGLLQTTRTAGGHRKVLAAEVIRFARDRGITIASPELLGLPPLATATESNCERSACLLAEALLAGDESLSREIVFHLALGNCPVARLFDDVIARSFAIIGDRWACQRAEVYQERRSCEIILRTLMELRKSQTVSPGSLTACGGTATGNLYSLQTLMAEVLLRDCGYQATSLGTAIPFDSLVQAIHELRPTLFWLSAAHILDEAEFLEGVTRVSSACAATQSALVAGGRALTPQLREQMIDVTCVDNMQQLAGFAKSLLRVHRRTLSSSQQPADRTP
ncbi:helix-turn-helix domain-containing protein [bacterium]|nr:helix-turn-helix domain-containing protein [bacterium]